jgi:NADH-quinone oxidoreductase subunit N
MFVMGKGINGKSKNFFINYNKNNFLNVLNTQIVHFIIFSCIIICFLIFSLVNKRVFFFDINFFSDDFILFVKFMAVLATLFVIFFSSPYLKNETILKTYEYFVLILLSLLAMFFLLSSNDFLSLYIAVEFQSLALYVLAAFKQNSLFSIEAGLKYFILGTFSSGLLLFGASLLYGFTGTLNFLELDMLFQFNVVFKDDLLFKLGLLFFFSSLMFKFTAAPFHMWAPDVYHGSPLIITFFFSLTPKIIFLGLFVRLVLLLFSPFEVYFKFIFFLCGFFSLLIGSLASIYQVKLKRLLAYSSISNVGYILMALSCAQVEALTSSLLFFLIYTFIMAGIFSVLLNLRYFNNNFKLKTIFELLGVINYSFPLAMLFVFNLFSLLGLPPFAGFLGKFYLFFSAIGSEFFFFLYLSILGSIFSAVIYLRMIRLIIFNKYNNVVFYKLIDYTASLTISILILFNIFIFCYSTEIFEVFYAMVINFFKTFFVLSFVF